MGAGAGQGLLGGPFGAFSLKATPTEGGGDRGQQWRLPRGFQAPPTSSSYTPLFKVEQPPRPS